MNTETHFCLRVDVDTFEGLKKGLPKCISFAKKVECPLTVYLSLGKYATGRNLFRRIKKKEKLNFTLPPWKRNNIKSLLRGVILPVARIGDKEKKLLKQSDQENDIEIHPHGFNHIKWSSNFTNFTYEKTQRYIDSLIEEYETIFNKNPISNASPNFQTNKHYFQLLEKKGFMFSSDFYYSKPFKLQFREEDGALKTCNVTQLPVTEPTIEELLLQRKSLEQIVSKYEKHFKQRVDEEAKYVCLYTHAIFEPIKFEKVLEQICHLAHKNDMKLSTHSEYYQILDKVPEIELSKIQC